jgi:putative spermidine/putrescine transport system permease protein
LSRTRLLAFVLALPAVALVMLALVIPLLLAFATAIRDPELREALPTAAPLLRQWDGIGLPPEPVQAALARELRAAEGNQALGALTRRMNFERSGMRSLLLRAARADLTAPYSMALPALDPRWSDPATWTLLRRAALGVTPLYLLRAVDLDLAPDGRIVAQPAEEAIFLRLFRRSLAIALHVTALTLLVAYPAAYTIARLPPFWARAATVVVLIPFWVSILVRTTAWFILLQRHGPVNAALVALGITDAPLQLIFTRFAVLLAMVHVLLPFAILPMVGVMKRIDPRLSRAAASLGARRWQHFLLVYLPLSLPGVGAGGLIVFMLAVGFYITPALVGGNADQMVSSFIAEYTSATLNWGMAGALALLLLAMTGAVIGLAILLVPSLRASALGTSRHGERAA